MSDISVSSSPVSEEQDTQPVDALRRFDRMRMLRLSLGAGVVFVGLLTLLLSGRPAALLLDRYSAMFPYPLTVQNLEHLAFFVALGELSIRWRVSKHELAFLDQHLLPEDDETVLQIHDLGGIRRKVARQFDGEHGFLPSLIDLGILQFQASRSVDQTVSVMNSSLELLSHRIDLRYQMVRYLAWFIPTVGFFGTVVGIGSTLGMIPESGQIDLHALSTNLAVAFDTTIVALSESAVVVFLMNVVQAREERAVNLAGGYCLKNLINRLYVGPA